MARVRRLESGTPGWAGLVGFIASYDAYALKTNRETLSGAFHRSIKHPWKRWPVVLLWATVTAHLFHFIPRRWDPIHLLAGLLTPEG